MPRTRTAAKTTSSREGALRAPSSAESAIYIYDMLISLKKMASSYKLPQLVRLLDAAAAEAEAVTKREAA